MTCAGEETLPRLLSMCRGSSVAAFRVVIHFGWIFNDAASFKSPKLLEVTPHKPPGCNPKTIGSRYKWVESFLSVVISVLFAVNRGLLTPPQEVTQQPITMLSHD